MHCESICTKFHAFCHRKHQNINRINFPPKLKTSQKQQKTILEIYLSAQQENLETMRQSHMDWKGPAYPPTLVMNKFENGRTHFQKIEIVMFYVI